MTKNTIRCFIIGEDNLHIECAKILKEKGHTVLGIVSSHESAEEWAINNDAPYYPSLAVAEEQLLNTSFDYLFSIVNPHILSQEILQSPQEFTINFHDSLLPRYAGVHATSWAILNRETTHGISWHVADEVVDTGDILQQAIVEIVEDETALSLNLKCYEAALRIFPGLVDALAHQSYQRLPQDLSLRTYFSYAKKPVGNGWIDWQSSAEEIERLFRATQLGNYTNRFSCTKFRVGDEGFIVRQLNISPSKSDRAPGTLIAYPSDHWQVATKTQDVIISGISTLDAHPISLQPLDKSGLYPQEAGILITGNFKFSDSGDNLEQQLPLHTPVSSEQFQAISQDYFAHEAYWVDRWKTFIPAEIPFLEKISSARTSCTYHCIGEWKLTSAQSAALSQFGNFETALFTVWLTYLFRLGNRHNLASVFIEPSSASQEFDCFFANELPLSVEFSDNINFQQAYQQVVSALSENKTHKTYLRDIFYRYPQLAQIYPSALLATVVASIENFDPSIFHYPLVYVIDPQNMRCSWYIDKECLANSPYLATVLNNILHHLPILLTGILENTQSLLIDLPLLTSQEYQQLLVDWNRTEKDYPREKTIHQLFEEQAEKNPHHIAVCFENKALTYRELNQQSNQLAHYLRQQGVDTESLVAICMERRLEMIIGMLAILKAGGAYLPIDPDYPKARIGLILEDAEPFALLTQSSIAKKLDDSTRVVIVIDKIKPFIKAQPKRCLSSLPYASQHLCYVIYTSGTTGKPKGVLVRHSNVVNTAFAKIKTFSINSNDRILNFSSISFDASVWEIFPCLLAGATLYLAKKDTILPGIKLANFIDNNKITIATLVPSVLAITPPPVTAHLRVIIAAGESCSKTILQQWANPRIFANAYGPTEATVCATIAIFDRAIETVTIGKPISNSKIFILDGKMQPLPVGVRGELYITGCGLAKGYLNRPELTKDRFLPWYWENEAQEISQVLYKTGDLARWLPDGNIEYQGRMDDQVKILGYRVELSELESVVMTYPNISQAAACLHKIEDKNQIDLFFTKTDNTTIHISQLQSFIKKNLPRHIVPSRIFEVSRFPLTINAKVDKNELLKNKKFLVSKSATHPISSNETSITKIFKKILGVDVLGVDDDFFFMGGDSILAMQLVSKINALGFKCSVRDIFQSPTIKTLTTKLTKKIPITSTEILAQDFFLSPIQQWFIEQDFKYPQQFVQVCCLEFQKPINVELLTCCFQEIIEWHEIFRMLFKKEENNWLQSYADTVNPSCTRLEVVDFFSNENESLDDFFQALTRQLTQDLNFETGRLLKAVLIRESEKITHLFMVAHHLIIDGVSWRILLDELQTLYEGSTNDQSVLQKWGGSTSYQQWVYALENYSNSSQCANTQAYWQLQHQPASIPIDYEKGDNIESSARYFSVELTAEETTHLLRNWSKIYHLSTDEILIALLTKTIMNWSQSNHVLIDIERHGREELSSDINLSSTIGWFTSLFPMFITLDRSLPLVEIIHAVHQQLQAVPRNGIDYGLLRYFKKIPFEHQAQVAFNYWGQFDQSCEQSLFNLKELKLISHPDNARSYLINIDVAINNKQLGITWTYSQNFHQQETIQQLSDNFLNNLKHLLQIESQIPSSLEYAKNFTQQYPLTPLQKGLLYHSLSSANSNAYVVQFYWTLDNDIDIHYLRCALENLIARHDVLRTRFVLENATESLQIVESKGRLNWSTYQWDIRSDKDKENYLQEFLFADRQAGFSLDEVSLIRATLLQISYDQKILVLTTHHILLDGWSLSILLQELGIIYYSLRQKQSPLLTPTLPFNRYVTWLQKQPLEDAKKFWKGYLVESELSTRLEQNFLFTHEPHPSITPQTTDLLLTLSASVTKNIKSFLRMHALTANTFFQGVWALLLQRYTQNDVIIFGIGVALRPDNIKGIEHALGLMINTLPLRVVFGAEQTVLTYLNKIQQNVLTILEYSFASLHDIQAWNKDLLKHSQELFQTLVVVENYPTTNIPELKLNFRNISIVDSTHYPLTVSIAQQDETTIKFSYDATKIDQDKLKSVIAHFETLMLAMIGQPKHSISSLSMLSAEEYQRLVYDWNPLSTQKASTQTIHALFEQQVSKKPDHIAIIFEQKQLTYRELNNQANHLASRLMQSGITPGTLIAIYLERGLSIMIAIIAALKVGGVYVPIDPHYPAKRIAYLLKDSQATFLLTEKHILVLSPLQCDETLHVLCVEDSMPHPINHDCFPNVTDQDLAYVIYTSGSTGNPKGTLITHRALTKLINSTQSLFHFDSTDHWSLFHSFNFDFSVWEMWGALLNGGTIHIVSSNLQLDLPNFYNWLAEQHITVLNVTPAVFYQIMSIDRAQCAPLSLRYVIFGGEALSIKALSPWFENHGYEQPQLINMYGITETTIHATYHVITSHSMHAEDYSIIGKPLSERSIYLLDKNRMPVPINAIGELYVGGSGVARGYLNKAQLTAEKFLPNPFVNDPHARLYRSGDLAKWLPNGDLVYVGRNDDQIKIRGFRIELGEIQAKIVSFPDVEQAFVMTHTKLAGDLLLTAYLVQKKAFSLKELRLYLLDYLPPYMIPSAYIFLEKLPLTANGKIDKQALPLPHEEHHIQRDYLAPLTHEEKKLTALWSKLLGMTSIGINDHFFELGGDSFAALKLLSSIEAEFKTPVFLRDFLQNPTVAHLTKILLRTQQEKQAFVAATGTTVISSSSSHCLVPLQPKGYKKPLFLIHPIGGTVFWYIALAKYLDPQRPLYGIQDPGLEEEGTIPYQSIEELATFYLKAIQSIQPQGSYYLGGASAGATISVEITRQLVAMNEDVAFIGLLDGWAPFPEGLHNKAFFEANMRRQYNAMHHQFMAKGIQQAESLLKLQWKRSRMISTYQVPVLNNKLTLFKAQQIMTVFKPLDHLYNHWDNHSTLPVEVHQTPGDHETMFEEPNVQVLAAQLNQCLNGSPVLMQSVLDELNLPPAFITAGGHLLLQEINNARLQH